MPKLSWVLLLALLQGQTTVRNPTDGAVVVMGTHADVLCQDSEAGFLVALTSKVDADYAIIRVYFKEKAAGMREPWETSRIEVVYLKREGTVMADPFPTKQADVQKVVVTWVTKSQEETFTPSKN